MNMKKCCCSMCSNVKRRKIFFLEWKYIRLYFFYEFQITAYCILPFLIRHIFLLPIYMVLFPSSFIFFYVRLKTLNTTSYDELNWIPSIKTKKFLFNHSIFIWKSLWESMFDFDWEMNRAKKIDIQNCSLWKNFQYWLLF